MRLAIASFAVCALAWSTPAGAATKEYSSGRLSVPIDGGVTAEHAIDVPDEGPISRVSVSIRLDHSRAADLVVSLVGPDGTTVALRRARPGPFGSGRRDCGGRLTVFEDEFSPAEEALARLDGRQARGSWTLRIKARAGKGAGRLFCWKLDISRDVVETVTAQSGNITAELSYREESYVFKNVRLKITREGSALLDAPLRALVCRDCPAEGTLFPGDDDPLVVRDLDGDGEPEVLLDLYTGGAHCCSYTLILRHSAGRYGRTLGWWGNYGYALRDYDEDGRPELSAADDRFAYAFVPYVASVPPVQIWHFERGRLIDVTRRFPALIAADASSLLRAYKEVRRTEAPEVRGILAGYMATQYLLGRQAQGWLVLERAYKLGDLGRGNEKFGYPAGRAYLVALRAFLRRTGYIR